MADASATPSTSGQLPTLEDEEGCLLAEQIAFSCDECYVYKIPPKRTAMGHRAEEWDVEHWIHEVRVQVVCQGDECRVVLLDKESGELFAAAPIPPGVQVDVIVEPVIDSSRYYVLRIEDSSEGRSRHAFVGIGFRHRPHSSDFSAAISEHKRYLQKKEEAIRLSEEWEDTKSHSQLDYSIQGAITVNIKNNKVVGRRLSDTKELDVFEEGKAVFNLPPPPSNAKTRIGSGKDAQLEEDVEFGDFVSS